MDVPCSQVVEILGIFASALSGYMLFGFFQVSLFPVFPAVAWCSVQLTLSLGVSSGSGTVKDSTS